MGEDVVLRKAKTFTILRTNLIGFHSPLRDSLFEWAYKNLLDGKPINGFDNVFFNPMYCGELAIVIDQLLWIEHNNGVYHVGSTDTISKFEFLKVVADTLFFPLSLIKPVRLEPNGLGAIRPLNTTLNTDKIQKLNITLPDMKRNIQALVNDFKQKQDHETGV